MNDKSKKLLCLERILRLMAVLVLKKYNPKIIGITGSVGKSSTKEAVFTVLATHYRTRKNEKNYNNEIGLPLTIIGAESGGKSFWGWTKVSLKWMGTILFPLEFPEVLVLEMAADRPGDMKYLVDFIKPQMGILTDISGSHMEFFKNLEGITREKGGLVKNLGEKGTAILNIDNSQIKKIKNQTKAKNITFGFSEEADVRATDVHYNYLDTANPNDAEIRGISFKLNYKGTTIPMRLNNILAEHNIYAALAGVAVGLEMGLNLVEIGAALEGFVLPYGRMNLILGIKNSAIIDDTYNSSPISAIAALKVLGEIKGKRKIAVLGDMLELGSDTEEGHREIARKFLEIKGDILIAVGGRMKYAVDELAKHNTDEKRIMFFNDPMSAGKKLQEIMEEGDIVLVKGSQGMRMEKVVEEVMLEPNKAVEYLCRQDKKWKSKPWRKV